MWYVLCYVIICYMISYHEIPVSPKNPYDIVLQEADREVAEPIFDEVLASPPTG